VVKWDSSSLCSWE